jgi:hypothetical protein
VSKLFSRSIQRYALISNELPLMRYFALAGGALLALLLAAGAITPRPPVTESSPGPHFPRIRIYSELKGPEAVVIDTSRPISVATPTQNDTGKALAPPHLQLAENVGQLVSPSLHPPDAKVQSKASPEPQPRSNSGKARIKRRSTSYAHRLDAPPFGGPWTFDQQDARFRESFAQMPPPSAEATQQERRGCLDAACTARMVQHRLVNAVALPPTKYGRSPHDR